ncbi:hypothetical protein O9992_21060 [Vibrio lentus]|nr:hypothetical protein [Vibrio lentus]
MSVQASERATKLASACKRGGCFNSASQPGQLLLLETPRALPTAPFAALWLISRCFAFYFRSRSVQQ